MFQLNRKVALVIGGTSGIGAESARWLARAGARVAIAGRRVDRGEDVVKALGPEALFVRTDVTVEREVRAMADAVVDRFGRVDILVTAAGVINRLAVPELSLQEWQRLVDVNLTGVFLACKYIIPIMQRQHAGAIIHVASFLGLRGGLGNTPAYNAAKAGVIALTQSLAVRHGTEGIRVNAVLPGFVPTELNRDRWAGATPEALEALAHAHPLGRLGTPADVAAAIVFLATDEAGWITGASLPVDGGVLAK